MALIFNQLPLVIITQSYLVKKVDAILDDLEWTMLMLVLTQPADLWATQFDFDLAAVLLVPCESQVKT